MPKQIFDMDSLFDGLYTKLTNPDFGKNLGGELPLFIQPLPAERDDETEAQINHLCNRLNSKGYSAISINLYKMCIDILRQEGILDSILEDEMNLSKDDIVSTLDSVLDIKTMIIPMIEAEILEKTPKYAFISGVGNAYPFVRSHGILNNIDELTTDCNLILFFPGEYNNLQLKLFGCISDENYYRGHNLNDYNS